MIVKTTEVARLLDYLGRLLIEANANGDVGDRTVPVPYHVLSDVETLLENVQIDQEDRDDRVAVKSEELRAVSRATALLRNALDFMPADAVSARQAVVDANKRILSALESVNQRDTSWH